MRYPSSPLFLVLTGFALATACGGRTENLGGDGDGDGDNGDGSGGTLGDGDTPVGDGDWIGTGAALGGGDTPGDGDISDRVCEPGAVQLCNAMVGEDGCTGIQLCAAEGPAWEACMCPDGVGAGGEGSGAQNAGGAGGADPIDDPGEPSCPDVTACGGDVAGSWVVHSSCLSVSGPLDIVALGLGCVSADISGSLQVSGSLSLSENGEFLDHTTTVGSVALGIAPACREVSGTVVSCEQMGGPFSNFGFSPVTCLDVPNGGCVCAGQVNQAGGMGHILPNASTNGEYSEGGAHLDLSTSDPLTYSYCAVEESLVVTPTGTVNFGTTHGTVVLARVQLR